MKTYSYMGKQCAIHIPAVNKKEAVQKLQEQGEAANMRTVYLLRNGALYGRRTERSGQRAAAQQRPTD